MSRTTKTSKRWDAGRVDTVGSGLRPDTRDDEETDVKGVLFVLKQKDSSLPKSLPTGYWYKSCRRSKSGRDLGLPTEPPVEGS